MILDAVTDGWVAVRLRVLNRDNGCIAGRQTLVGPAASPDECRDKWGVWISYDAFDYLELDHVKEQPMMGRKAPDDEAHLVSVCPEHHRKWATANREAERAYLARFYPAIWGSQAANGAA